MSANDENQLKNRQKTKYLWLGYGNYSNSPAPQINSGLVRDPALFEPLLQFWDHLWRRLSGRFKDSAGDKHTTPRAG